MDNPFSLGQNLFGVNIIEVAAGTEISSQYSETTLIVNDDNYVLDKYSNKLYATKQSIDKFIEAMKPNLKDWLPK